MTPLPSSRLSRELGAPIYSFNFGSRTRKPRYLHPLQIHGKDTLFPDLVAVAGKESGMMYYSASHLSKSATACSVLRGCDRLPLAHSIPFRLPSPGLPCCHYVFVGVAVYTSKEQFCGARQTLSETSVNEQNSSSFKGLGLGGKIQAASGMIQKVLGRGFLLVMRTMFVFTNI